MQADHSPGYEFTSRMAVHHWPVVPLFGLLDAALPESPGLDCGARLKQPSSPEASHQPAHR
jgi:hypothetical protein